MDSLLAKSFNQMIFMVDAVIYPTFTDWALVLKDEQVSPDRKVMVVTKLRMC
jgi:hypothetical protein